MGEKTELMTVDNICNRVYVIRGQRNIIYKKIYILCNLLNLYVFYATIYKDNKTLTQRGY